MLIAIGFMYLCALALFPLVGFSVWALHSGDQMREEQERARRSAAPADLQLVATPAAATPTPRRVATSTTVARGA